MADKATIFDAILNASRPEDILKRLTDRGWKSDNKGDLELARQALAEREKKILKGIGGTSGSGGEDKDDTSDTNPGVLFLKNILKSQEAGQQVSYSISQQISGVDDLFDTFFDSNTGKLKDFNKENNSIIGAFTQAVADSYTTYLSEQTYLMEEINTKTSLTGQLSKDYRDELTRAQPELIRLGISTRELGDAAVALVQNSGRFNLINRETFIQAGQAARAYVGTLDEIVGMYPDFEKIGLGASDATREIAEAGRASLELGLNAKGVVKDLSSSVSKLNEYGFSNGVQGLARMVQLSKEFRMDINTVFTIADKLFDPSNALEMSANLQVLGGSIGAFNDPMQLMYMATNNVEGLQGALIGAAEGLATYNEEQGRFELTGANLRLAKARADALGVSFQEFSKAAVSGAERAGAKMDLLSKGFSIDDKQMEFLTNISQMKDGKMQIELQSEFIRSLDEFKGLTSVSLENLTEEQATALLKYQEEFEKMSDNDIVRNQATAVENIKRDVAFMVASLRLQGGKAVEQAAQLTGFDLKEVAEMTQEYSKLPAEWVTKMSDKIKQEFKIDVNETEERIRNERLAKMGKSEEKSTETSTSNSTQTIKKESHYYIHADQNIQAEHRNKFVEVISEDKDYRVVGTTTVTYED